MPDSIENLDFKRDEDFASLYANNLQFEASVWDLKMIFGQLDQAKSVVEQHTAMAISWPQAKITAYFVLLNVLIHQSQNGPIQLPSRVIPKRPDPADPELNEGGKKVIEYLAWVHDQFFSDHPYVPPNPTGGTDSSKFTE